MGAANAIPPLLSRFYLDRYLFERRKHSAEARMYLFERRKPSEKGAEGAISVSRG